MVLAQSLKKDTMYVFLISILAIFLVAVVSPFYSHGKKISAEEKTIGVAYTAPVPTVVETPVVETPEEIAPTTPKKHFDRNLVLGDKGPDVKMLQEYLNEQGFIIASTGPGSLGHETELFGKSTKAALAKFQEAHADVLLKPYGITAGTGYFGEATRAFLNSQNY